MYKEQIILFFDTSTDYEKQEMLKIFEFSRFINTLLTNIIIDPRVE